MSSVDHLLNYEQHVIGESRTKQLLQSRLGYRHISARAYRTDTIHVYGARRSSSRCSLSAESKSDPIKGGAHNEIGYFIMSDRMRRFLPMLRRINKLGDKTKRQYVKKCNKEFIDCISECAKNVLRGNVPLKSSQIGRLRRHKQDLRALSIKKTSLRKKRRILQKGGFLGAILTPVLSLLGGLISNAIR